MLQKSGLIQVQLGCQGRGEHSQTSNKSQNRTPFDFCICDLCLVPRISHESPYLSGSLSLYIPLPTNLARNQHSEKVTVMYSRSWLLLYPYTSASFFGQRPPVSSLSLGFAAPLPSVAALPAVLAPLEGIRNPGTRGVSEMAPKITMVGSNMVNSQLFLTSNGPIFPGFGSVMPKVSARQIWDFTAKAYCNFSNIPRFIQPGNSQKKLLKSRENLGRAAMKS